MNCRQVRRSLSEYIDGELTHVNRYAVEAHLSGCAGCREECEAERRMARLLVAMPGRQLGAEFDVALQTRLQAIDTDRAKRPAWVGLWERFRPHGFRDWRPLLAPLGIAALAVALSRPTLPPPAEVAKKPALATYLAQVVVEHLGTNGARELPEREAVDEALRANSVESLFQ